jgi:hypothetical protein
MPPFGITDKSIINHTVLASVVFLWTCVVAFLKDTFNTSRLSMAAVCAQEPN